MKAPLEVFLLFLHEYRPHNVRLGWFLRTIDFHFPMQLLRNALENMRNRDILSRSGQFPVPRTPGPMASAFWTRRVANPVPAGPISRASGISALSACLTLLLVTKSISYCRDQSLDSRACSWLDVDCISALDPEPSAFVSGASPNLSGRGVALLVLYRTAFLLLNLRLRPRLHSPFPSGSAFP